MSDTSPTSEVDRRLPLGNEIFLDHVAHFVSDRDAAIGALVRAGFAPTPVSIQVNADPAGGPPRPTGTGNVTCMLDRGYLEILFKTADTPLGQEFDAALARYRGVRLADKRALPANRVKWIQERDRIYEEVMTRGWNEKRRAFTQFYGSDDLDASLLIMPLVFFISPTDPRMIGTIDLTMAELVSDSLVHRYEMGRGAGDGLTGSEGTFNMCTFWLVEALTRAGRLEEARFIFEKMLTYANHLGLYAEEIGPSGEALGNFPQAFTHMGLISAAFNLDRRLASAG